MEELVFLGGLAADLFFERSDACDDFVRNFMVSVVRSTSKFFLLCIDTNM